MTYHTQLLPALHSGSCSRTVVFDAQLALAVSSLLLCELIMLKAV